MIINRERMAYVSSAGPASYASGGFGVNVYDLRKVLHVISVKAVNSGYLPVVASTSGNRVTIKVFDTTTGDEVANGTNLSSKTFEIIATGF